MTLSEFKAWLDGFGAAIDGAPSADQWDAIKAKLAEVRDHAPIWTAPAVPTPHLPPNPSAPPPYWLSPVTCGGNIAYQA